MKMLITGSKTLQNVSEVRKSIKRMGYNPSVVYTYDRKGIDDCVKRMRKSFKYDHIVRKYDTKDKKVFRDNLKDMLTRVDNVVMYWDGYSKEVFYIQKWCEQLNKNYQIIKMKK